MEVAAVSGVCWRLGVTHPLLTKPGYIYFADKAGSLLNTLDYPVGYQPPAPRSVQVLALLWHTP